MSNKLVSLNLVYGVSNPFISVLIGVFTLHLQVAHATLHKVALSNLLEKNL